MCQKENKNLKKYGDISKGRRANLKRLSMAKLVTIKALK